MKKWMALLLLLCTLTAAVPAGMEAEEAEPVADQVTESVLLEDIDPLPIDFSAGHVAPESNYSGDVYEDESLSVRMERVTTDKAVFNVAHVRIADPSQFRTAVTAWGRTNKVSAIAEKMNAVVAIGGEYFASDEGGFIVRMGEAQPRKNSKKKTRNSPYETRDLLCIDEEGNFHIIIRYRDAKKDGKSKTINPDYDAQLAALKEAHTLVNVFDFGPALVMDGICMEMPDSYSFNLEGKEPRCAIGQIGPLEYVLVVVDTLEHHDRSGKSGATGAMLARFMYDLGCQQAYNLDGGNSCLMVFHGENYSDKTVSEERSVSDIIYFATAVDAGLDGE